MVSFISSLVLGLLAGYLACRIMGQGSDLVLNLIVGVVGSIIGNFLCRIIGIYAYGWIAQLLISIVGACVLLWVVHVVVGRRR